MPSTTRLFFLGQNCAVLAAVFVCTSIGGIAEAQMARFGPDGLRIARLPRVDKATDFPEPVVVAPPPQDTAAEFPEPVVVTPVPQELVAAPEPETLESVGGPYLVPGWLQPATVERANVSCDAQRWLSRFDASVGNDQRRQPPLSVERLPENFRPWWEQPVCEPTSPAMRVSLDHLVQGALRYSSYVQVVSTEPQILRTAVVEEDAEFDWHAFLETTYHDTSDPVGNVLTTGTNEDRFKDRIWTADGGVRRENRLGGHVELFQRLGTQENNSRFLMPNPQATSQLELRYTQPLLNGAGYSYNESRIVLAQIQANISSDDLIEELQDHLYKVSEAYWELYRARAQYFQRLKLIRSAEETLVILEGRTGLDAVQRQVLRRAGRGRHAAVRDRSCPHLDLQRRVSIAIAGQ